MNSELLKENLGNADSVASVEDESKIDSLSRISKT